MIRTFRARVHLFTLDREQQARADCFLSIELEKFGPPRWSDLLTNLHPSTPPAGRYLIRFPNGRAGEVQLGRDEFTGCPFTGIGALPKG